MISERNDSAWKLIEGRLVTPRNNVVIDVLSDRLYDTKLVHAAVTDVFKVRNADLSIAGLYNEEEIFPVPESFGSNDISELLDYMELLYEKGQSLLLITRLKKIESAELKPHISLIWPMLTTPNGINFLDMRSERVL